MKRISEVSTFKDIEKLEKAISVLLEYSVIADNDIKVIWAKEQISYIKNKLCDKYWNRCIDIMEKKEPKNDLKDDSQV